jgi:AraC-like DNA-binding protein
MSRMVNRSLFGPTVVSCTADDAEVLTQALCDGLRSEYVQLEARPFRARWTSIQCATVVIQFASQEISVVRRLRVAANRWGFMVPLAVTRGARWNGRPASPDEILVCPPESICLAFDPPPARFAIVTVPVDAPIVAALGTLLSQPKGDPIAFACECNTSALRERLVRLRMSAESPDASARLRAFDEDAADVSVCLAQALASHRGVVKSGRRVATVCRIDGFVRRHFAEGLPMATLSSVVGISDRSVRTAFRDVLTTSPKRYMTLWRLNQVRRTLRNGDPSAMTVTDVATRFGFYELGRFAASYKSLFAESPSQTLNRRAGDRVASSAAA